ncbi:MAG: acylphosphatase, partial [Actinomycetota bacterium]
MRTRQRLRVTGTVQGVGFRPFVHRLADGLVLGGFVRNEPGRVHIEVEGRADDVRRFTTLLADDPPPLASIDRVETESIPALGDAEFRIESSRTAAPDPARARVVPPDVATCDACLAELFDPADRRFGHPFITCTDCGPRYTIITALPYDRPNTTMAGFELCPDCRAEYDDLSAADRARKLSRAGGPAVGVELDVDGDGEVLARANVVLKGYWDQPEATAEALRDG